MTFQQLQYLVEARKAGSISQAAKNLFLTPSSISVAITNLEQELGYPIFVRTTQGLIPTAEGEKVLRYAGRILDNYRLLDDILPSQGNICLNLADHDMIGAAFARLAKEYQGTDISFSVTGINLDPAIQKLLANEIDLDVRFIYTHQARKLESSAETQGLAWELLAAIPAAARVGPNHRLYNAPSVSPSVLEQETLIEPASRPFSKSNILKGFINIDPNKTIASACSSVRRWLLSSGQGYFIVPLVPDEIDNQFKLHRIPIDGLAFRLYAIHNPRHPMRPEVSRFLELLKQELKKPLPQP